MGHAKILVADDSLTIQKVIKITLSKEPFHIFECKKESDLFPVIERSNFDLVLLDFNFSDSLNGYDLVKKLLKVKPDLKIVIMHNNFSAVDENILHELGVINKVIKPFQSSLFIQICKDAVADILGQENVDQFQEDNLMNEEVGDEIEKTQEFNLEATQEIVEDDSEIKSNYEDEEEEEEEEDLETGGKSLDFETKDTQYNEDEDDDEDDWSTDPDQWNQGQFEQTLPNQDIWDEDNDENTIAQNSFQEETDSIEEQVLKFDDELDTDTDSLDKSSNKKTSEWNLNLPPSDRNEKLIDNISALDEVDLPPKNILHSENEMDLAISSLKNDNDENSPDLFQELDQADKTDEIVYPANVDLELPDDGTAAAPAPKTQDLGPTSKLIPLSELSGDQSEENYDQIDETTALFERPTLKDEIQDEKNQDEFWAVGEQASQSSGPNFEDTEPTNLEILSSQEDRDHSEIKIYPEEGQLEFPNEDQLELPNEDLLKMPLQNNVENLTANLNSNGPEEEIEEISFNIDSSNIPEEMKEFIQQQLRDQIKTQCKEAIERIAWEVIPDLAEKIISRELDHIKDYYHNKFKVS